MALRETAMTAPLGQQGEPRAANGRPYESLIGSLRKREKARVPENTGQKTVIQNTHFLAM